MSFGFFSAQQQEMPARQLPTAPPQSASVLQGNPQLQRQVRVPTRNSGSGVLVRGAAVAGQIWPLAGASLPRSRAGWQPGWAVAGAAATADEAALAGPAPRTARKISAKIVNPRSFFMREPPER